MDVERIIFPLYVFSRFVFCCYFVVKLKLWEWNGIERGIKMERICVWTNALFSSAFQMRCGCWACSCVLCCGETL